MSCNYLYFLWKGAPLKGIDSVYGSGNGSIILDNVVCNGNEDNLLLCAHNVLFDTNCDHTEDAAVVCNGKHSGYTSKCVISCFLQSPVCLVPCGLLMMT